MPTSSVSSADPNLHADPGAARKVGRRFAQISPDRRDATASWRPPAATWRPRANSAADDESFAAEVPELESTVDELDTQLTDLLAPRDPHDADDIVLEVKSGEGGEESALFAADLARMYIRYAERHGWTVDGARRDLLGPGRLQGRDAVDQQARATPPTASGRG